MSDARMYFIPGTGTGAAAGPRQGMYVYATSEQPTDDPPNATPAAAIPTLVTNWRLLITLTNAS